MPDLMANVYAVLLAGGSGTRLWPVSRKLYPKQLVKFIGKNSLVQSTIKRLSPVLDTERIRIVCGEEHFHETARHMSEIGVQSEGKIICEPCGRNTAPAILLAVFNILRSKQDPVLCVFPADHVIRNIESFHNKLNSAVHLAEKGYIVTFGIKPNYPETGYGYVEGAEEIFDGALAIKRFVEKPDAETAKKYVKAGNFFWNSGMFAFMGSVMIEEFRKYQPELLKIMEDIISRDSPITVDEYKRLPDISIDHAIMENTDKGVVLPSDFGWSDIGSWKSLYEFLPKDENNNVIDGDVIAKDTKNCFIMSRDRLIATNHLNRMVVVETPDSVFISDIDNSRDVKSIVNQLKGKGRREYQKHKTVYHPWGSRTVLEQEDDIKVERLAIYPGSNFQFKVDSSALQHLIMIKGRAEIISDRQTEFLDKGESKVISGNESIKIDNPGKELVYIIRVNISN
ncbi:MAG: mannose-1-phosphate guanylyltransferase/mannose-6-phosphate isomerase [Proteobacteria bacterium]|nr:mannose-1-phosphate guanylyltransferase/mannose-6-phosphate isomerase [Pseudomonadota bacterium]MBU4286541.1 mannose-1-phosphate guanylyltransferase/mannose-6-phosphate isomerase [Pseudomonadota bacterium]MCG2758520.1 mannose-1-phosphate guanylyltransferase/mannose-6-phosphate isomerase [Desulfobacteraceae bacterium]